MIPWDDFTGEKGMLNEILPAMEVSSQRLVVLRELLIFNQMQAVIQKLCE
jgi:hypothetical protein